LLVDLISPCGLLEGALLSDRPSRSGSSRRPLGDVSWRLLQPPRREHPPVRADLSVDGRRGPDNYEAVHRRHPDELPEWSSRWRCGCSACQRAASHLCARAAEKPAADRRWAGPLGDHYREGAQRPPGDERTATGCRWAVKRPRGSMRFDEAALEEPRSIRPVVDNMAPLDRSTLASSPTCPCTSCRPTQPAPEPRSRRLVAPPPSAIKGTMRSLLRAPRAVASPPAVPPRGAGQRGPGQPRATGQRARPSPRPVGPFSPPERLHPL